MKKLAYVLGILLATLMLTPWIVGFYSKQEYLDLITAINQTNQAKVTILEYRMGWLHSYAKMSIDFYPSKNMPPITLTADTMFTHGPIVYDKTKNKFIIVAAVIKNTLHLPAPIETLLLSDQRFQGILQANATVTFDSNWTIQLTIPVISSSLPNGTKFSWQGLTDTFNLKINHHHIDLLQNNVTFGALTTMGPAPENLQINMQPTTLAYNISRHVTGLWVGSYKILMPSLLIKNLAGKNISITNFNVDVKSDITENIFYNSTEQLIIEKIEIPGAAITMIAPVKITLAFNNLNTKGIIEFNDLSKTNGTLEPSQLRDQSFTMISRIITPSSNAVGNVFINTSLGALTATGKTFFSPNTPAFTTTHDMLKNNNLEANIRISIPLLSNLIEYYFQILGLKNDNSLEISFNPTTNTGALDQASVEMFNDKIATLMKQGKLSLSSSLEVMILSNKNITSDQFNEELKKLNIPPATASQIMQIYAQVLTLQQTKQKTIGTDSPADKANTFIMEWLKQGYIIRDNNDYIISITQNNGSLKINGKIFNSMYQ